MNISVKFTGVEPLKATENSVAFDLYAQEDALIYPGEVAKIPTGTSIELPSYTEGLLNIRSSLGSKGIMLANGTGIIDSDYRGEIFVVVYNGNIKNSLGLLSMNALDFSYDKEGVLIPESFPGAFKINAGDRIAQLRVREIPHVSFQRVEELSTTQRGSGGFGSTGVS